MLKSTNQWPKFIVLITFLNFTGCSKKNAELMGNTLSAQEVSKKSATANQGLINNGDTILNVTYENSSTNSGITGLNPTNATAGDAAYIVGAAGTYRIAHKVTLGMPGYFSNEAYRSESDADQIADARFLPGDERRYEFMVLLKDWQEWNPANPAYGNNIFQLKVSGGALVPMRILTKRNAIVTRNTTNQDELIADFRPYINKWIHFRIDVKWASDQTGYLKIYVKPEGQANYTLVLNRANYATYTGTGLSGQHGYIKWGVYREAGTDANGNVITSDNVLTRIAYHDNIKIIKLPLQ